jgi:Zn-dependent protease with chaperone function
MMRRLWLIGLILGVPCIGFAVAAGIQAHFAAQLRSTVQEQYTDVAPKALAQLSLDRICQTPTPELSSVCSTNQHLNLMRTAALWAGGVGLALLLGIHLAGWAARTNRQLLLCLFKPGLYLTAVVLLGLILVHAAVAMATIYYGESALIEAVHIQLVGVIGLGALLGIAMIARNVFTLVRKAQTFVIGMPVTRQQAPMLWQRVDEIAQQLGALLPEHLVVGLDPNFFVTEADVLCLNGMLSGRTLYCSLPLCRILNQEEFSAIIGHELGHYKGLDTQFSQKFFPIYRGTASSVASLYATEGAGVIALLPTIAVLSYFLESFSVAESRISRLRELAADQQGVAVTNTETLAAALVKVHAFVSVWEGMQQTAVAALREGKGFVNVSKAYAEVVSTQATAEAFKDITATHLYHPTDSHPPLMVRLEALRMRLQDVSAAALDVRPTQAAIDFFPEAEAVEEGMSEAYHILLARPGAVLYGELQENPLFGSMPAA